MESTAVTSGARSAAARTLPKRTSERKTRRSILLHPLDQVIPDTQRVGHDGQSRINRRTGRKEAAVHDVQVVEFVRLAVHVECGSLRIAAEPDGAVLVSHARQRNALAEEQIPCKEPLVTLAPVQRTRCLLLHQLF